MSHNAVPEDCTALPLYVDLDGTLLRTDLLLESFLELIKQNLLYLLLIPLWLLRGKAALKREIARRVQLRVELLPWNADLLAYLREQKSRGRRLVLISAADQLLVEAVAAHLDLFDAAIGSDGQHNCGGAAKQQRIAAEAPRYVYGGDRAVDIAVWRHAAAAIAVDVTPALRQRLAALVPIEAEFPRRGSRWRASLRAMRLHQWLKNLLVLLPLALAHELGNSALLLQALLAFVSFGLCASSVYVLNDLLDLPSDRAHHSKHRRPFASGELPLLYGLLLSPLLLVLAFALASTLPGCAFVGVLALYYLCTGLYSFVLKRIMLVDVIVLAGLYTLRIIAGAAAVGVALSFWLLAFSMFLFFSLAVVKRYTELDHLQKAGVAQSHGRGYLAQDLPMMALFGSASALMSVMVFALYINNEDTRDQYATPELLWLLCPLLLYLITRIWLLAARGQVAEDPIVYAIRDRTSQALMLVGAMLLWLAILDWRALL
jgi:4-hydroxybenzoate polyprenyltransferase/phosphoserine phosphatase